MAETMRTARVVGASVRGAAHVRVNLPNQDAMSWLPESGEGPDLVVAVSDGHGSAKSFRSRAGAEAAVRIATRLISRHLSDWARSPADQVQADLRAAGRDIVERWADAIGRDIGEHPYTADEMAALDQRAQRELTSNALLAYGTTLLLAAVTADRVYALQVGDGDVVFVARDGTAWLPLPPDDRIAGNETTSLCMPQAWEDMRFCVRQRGDFPRLILLSTDGYANSFQSEQAFLQVGGDLLSIITRKGIGAVDREIRRWLEETTAQGAGDDVTLAVLDVTLPPGEGAATAPPAPAAAPRSVRVGPPAATPPLPAAHGATGPTPVPVTERARAPSWASTGTTTSAQTVAVGGPVVPPPDDGPRVTTRYGAGGRSVRFILAGFAVGMIVLVGLGWWLFGGTGSQKAPSPNSGTGTNPSPTTSSVEKESTAPPPARTAGTNPRGEAVPTPDGFPPLVVANGCAYLLDAEGRLWSQSEASGAAEPASPKLEDDGPWERLQASDGGVEVTGQDNTSRIFTSCQ